MESTLQPSAIQQTRLASPPHARRVGLWVSAAHLPALGLYFVITLIMTWPNAARIQTSLFNWSDPLLNTWAIGWGAHALLTDPLHLYNANIFYPYANTLAYSESLLPQAALGMPVILATNMPAFAHNLLALASFVLSAFGMYLLTFQITRSRAAGLVAGMIYTFTSYKLMHFSHLQLLSSQWLPFALLYLRRLFPENQNPAVGIAQTSSRNAWRNAFLFAVFFALQALSSFYYAFFMAGAAALYVIYVFLLRIIKARKALRLSRSGSPITRQNVGGLVMSIALIALFTLPLSLPYFSVQRDLGLERGTKDVEYYAATAQTYFSVPNGNWLYARWLAPRAPLTGSGERDFIGFVAFGLVIVGLVGTPRRDSTKWFFVLLAIAGIILSLGARNHILLFPGWPRISLPFYLPYRYLFDWIPGFKAMRGPDRFALFAILGAAVLAGYGTRSLLNRVPPRLRGVNGRGGVRTQSALLSVLPIALIALIGLENITIPVQTTNPATLARPLPEAAAFIASTPADVVVLELPMFYGNDSLAWPQYYSLFHWHKLVNGFSGFFPPPYVRLASATRKFPDEKSYGLLTEIGVQLVVVHNELLTPEEQAGIRNRLAQFSSRVEKLRHFANDDEVYQLSGTPSWGVQLTQAIPPGARVWLRNSNTDRRPFFDIASEFLRGRDLYGNPEAAYRLLRPLEPGNLADYVVMNAGEDPPEDLTRRVWGNNYLVVYGR